jgi:hypothetical protein
VGFNLKVPWLSSFVIAFVSANVAITVIKYSKYPRMQWNFDEIMTIQWYVNSFQVVA